MPIKYRCNDLSCRIPATHDRIIVDNLVYSQREINICCPRNIAQTARFRIGQHFSKYFYCGAVPKELPGGELVSPKRHSVLNGPVVVCLRGKIFAGYYVKSIPLKHPIAQFFVNELAVVVLRPRRSIASHPLVATFLSCFGPSLDLAFDHNGIQLLPHVAGLSLPLYFLAIDHSPAIWKRTGSIAVGDGAG